MNDLNFLSPRQLYKAWQFALEEMNDKAKKSDESTQVHMARCWAEGIFRAIKSEEFDVCIKKNDVTITFVK